MANTYFSGVDRAFIFFQNSGGVPWKGITSVDEDEEDFRYETYYVDGKKVGHSHIAGDYSASVNSYDDPTLLIDDVEAIFGFSYREHYNSDGENQYRLHLVQNIDLWSNGSKTETVNQSSTPTTYSWGISAIGTDLSDEVFGSHLILDSGVIQPWIMRDIENILYGTGDNEPKIPSIDEIYDIFATMNLVIIDHGDGTWSAVGHETMIKMLDATEFAISSPTAEYVEEDTYEIESLIRDERWLE